MSQDTSTTTTGRELRDLHDNYRPEVPTVAEEDSQPDYSALWRAVRRATSRVKCEDTGSEPDSVSDYANTTASDLDERFQNDRPGAEKFFLNKTKKLENT